MSPAGHHFFWSGPFSQWQRSEFTHDGVRFVTAEQAMMYQKAKLFADDVTASEILETEEPGKQKALGRKVRNFDQAIWQKHREDIVYQISFSKFDQNKGLRRKLFQTADLELVEASPFDAIWGIGIDAAMAETMEPDAWPGMNLLGKTLTRVRQDLKECYPAEAEQVAKDAE